MKSLRGMALEAYDKFVIGLVIAPMWLLDCITAPPCGGESGRSPVDRGNRGPALHGRTEKFRDRHGPPPP